MQKSKFREGKYADFYIYINDKKISHNLTILSLKSEFFVAKVGFNSEAEIKFDTDQLGCKAQTLENALNYLYEDTIPICKNMQEVYEYWQIYDYLLADFHKNLAAKEIIRFIIERLDLIYEEKLTEILKEEDFREEVLGRIFQTEELVKMLADKISYNIFNKTVPCNYEKYIDFIETFNLQRFLNGKTIGKLGHYATTHGIEKSWLPMWQNMILMFSNVGSITNDLHYDVIGKRNKEGEILPLSEADKEYMKNFGHTKISFKVKGY